MFPSIATADLSQIPSGRSKHRRMLCYLQQSLGFFKFLPKYPEKKFVYDLLSEQRTQTYGLHLQNLYHGIFTYQSLYKFRPFVKCFF